MLAKLIHILSLMAFAAVNYNAEPKWKSFAFFIDVWYSQIWKMAKRNGSRNNINIHSGFLSLANVRLCCVQAFECYMQRLGRLNVVYAAILCLQLNVDSGNEPFSPEWLCHWRRWKLKVAWPLFYLPTPPHDLLAKRWQWQQLSRFTLLMLERGGWRRDSSAIKLGFLFFHDHVFFELQSSPTITSYMHELRNVWEFYFPF